MKALIIKTSSMGDIIHTLPALTDAGQKCPNITFDWVVEENFAEIPKWHNLVNKVIPVALRRWRKHPVIALKNHEWREFRRNLTHEQYDLIIDAQGLIKSAIITRMANGLRCGMDKHSAREPLATLFYQRKFPIAKKQHAVTRIRQLFANILGYACPITSPDYNINLASLPIKPTTTDKYLVFIHGSTRDNKLWLEDNWIKLTQLAAKENYLIKLPWGNQEELERAQRIAKECENAQVLPKMSLGEVAWILIGAKGVVAVDTGLGHLGAALDIPIVSLYGPTNPSLIGTYSKTTKHLLTKTPEIVDISPTEVWSNLLSILYIQQE